VIGHPNLNKNILESAGLGSAIPELAPSLMARTFEQFSVLLPDSGPDAKAPTPVGRTKGFVPVNKPVKNGQKMTVDGVEMIFYTDFDSDSDDQVMIYLPKSKTVLNNHLWPTYPNFYTLRGSIYRDPSVWAAGIQLIRNLDPEHLFNTHAFPLSGKEKIQKTLSGYYDAIMYLYDQTIRGILHGKTPDELRYTVQLPKDLATQPHNQLAYGEFSYYPPYIYQYAIGWFGRDTENLNRISPEDQARKIVHGFGGADAVKAELKKTLENKEYAWAAELGGYLLRTAPDDKETRQLLADALRQMGYNTEASIPRSWYLTRALAMEGKLHIPAVVFGEADDVAKSAPDTFIKQYRVRLDPRASYGKEQLIAITLEGTDAPTMGLHVRSGVAEFVPDVGKHYRQPDGTIQMSMVAWATYFVGDITLDTLLERKDVTVSDKAVVKAFFSLFDQVHPSKTALIPASTF
jgi:alkyl sulfatase BDS1-like metallo-beta-lactamase superfamily hydrolase